MISLIVSTGMFFVARFTTQVLSRTILAVIKTCLLLRVLRSYTVVMCLTSHSSSSNVRNRMCLKPFDIGSIEIEVRKRRNISI